MVDVYTGDGSALTGSARVAQLERERMEEMLGRQEAEAKRAEIQHWRAAAVAQIEALQTGLAATDGELHQLEADSALRVQETAKARAQLARSRMADGNGAKGASNAV